MEILSFLSLHCTTFSFRLVLQFVSIGSSTLVLTNGEDTIFDNPEVFDSIKYSLNFVRFLMEYENSHCEAQSTSKDSIMLPESYKILLTTVDQNACLCYVYSLITYIKYHQFMPEQALISSEIISYIIHHSGIRRTLSKELKENVHQIPNRNDRCLTSCVIALITENIDKLLTESMDISMESTASNTSIIESNNSSNTEKLFSTTKDDLTMMINNLIKYFVDNNTSLFELERLAKLLNSMPGARIILPTTRYLLMIEMQSRCVYDCTTYIYCKKCSVYSKKTFFSPDECLCKQCCAQIHSKSSNSFIYISLEAQIRSIMLHNWKSVIEYLQAIREKTSDEIEDVYDGKILQKVMKDNEYFLSLTVNTDGVSYEKSNTKSVWPLQLICNFLPPQIRFNMRNIIVSAIYYGEKKPNLLQYFEPLAEEMQHLQIVGLTINRINLKIFITHGTFDLPAKAQAQNSMQYNGYDGCGYCHHHGIAIGKTLRFPNGENIPKSRSHDEMVQTMEKIHTSGKQLCIDGVKGISPMIAFDGFDLVYSFGVDYMHNTLLGVMKTLLNLWLSPEYKTEFYYIQKGGRDKLDKRILSLKLCVSFLRKPRPMIYRHQFKASEYRAMLLYYIGLCLDGILKEKYLVHFRLLSSAIYKLLCTRISQEDLEDSAKKIDHFIEQFQEYYGENKMTMNINMLKHIPQSVENLGPIWCYSMFSFETNNGILGGYFNGTHDIIKQIALRYILKRKQNDSDVCNKSSKRVIWKILEPKTTIDLTGTEMVALSEHKIPVLNNEKFIAYERLQKDDNIYTSVLYKKAQKSIDYFISFGDEKIGKIKFYFFHNNMEYAMVNVFLQVERKDHIREITDTNESIVISIENIHEKYIYINVNTKHFVVFPPNKFEKD